jgi:DEAD/DEAH box helicase domain-containing protein
MIPLRKWGAEVLIELENRKERIDRYHAVIECYPHGVFYSHGIPYFVTQLDQKHDRVFTERRDLSYDTKPTIETEVNILQVVQKMEDGPFHWVRGKVRVTQHVTGFTRRAIKTKEILGSESFPQPYSYSIETNALWMTFSDEFLKRGDPNRLYPVLHAAEHGWLKICPLLIRGDRDEMNGVSVVPYHPETERASIFLYEESEGGNGYGERIYPHVRDLIRNTLRQLEACPCSNGCNRCIQKSYCHFFNVPLEKRGAIKLLRWLAQRFG